jgi:hypothetical protein
LKIIDAVWEKRNLGVSAREVSLEQTDTAADLAGLADLDCSYAVVKVPAGKIDLMFKLEDLGFRFIETMFDLRHDLRDIGGGLSGVVRRLTDSVRQAEMDSADLAELFRQFHRNIFYTDRIYIDPAFTAEQAARRYTGWINDEMERGAVACKCLFKERTVGFFVMRIDEKKVGHLILAGLYRGYENSGLGLGVGLAEVRAARARGCSYCLGRCSSNNLAAMNMNLGLGFRVVAAKYIYVKHKVL